MYDLIVGIVESFIKHGMSLSALGMALFVLLKQRKVKRLIRKRLPWLLRDDADVVNYEARQIRIESKIDALMSKEGIKWDAEKISLSQNTAKNSLTSSWVEKSSAHTVGVFIQKGLTIISRGNRTMKAYLKKLSRTKLQAYLLATIMNIALLVGYVLDIQDIQSKVEAWMPMANMTVQTVLTLIYVWVEGSIDKEQVKAQNPEVKTNEEFNTNTEHFE